MRQHSPVVYLICALQLPMTISCTPNPDAVVEEYLASIERRDLEGTMSALAPDFRLEGSDGVLIADRSDMPTLLGWDFQARPRIHTEEVHVTGDTVRALISEENDFTRLLGLAPWRSDATFLIRNGVIVRETLRTADGVEHSVHEVFESALSPVLSWAERYDPDRYAILGGGEIVRRDSTTARVLLEVIRSYRRARP